MIMVKPEMIEETSAFAQDVFIDYYNGLLGNAQAVYMADLFLSEKAITQLIQDGAVFRIIRENDRIIGFCEYKKEEERVFLSKLYAHRHYRGMGIGRLMFEDVVSYTKKNDNA